MSIILEGVIKQDGTLELRGNPMLPAGPVRVTLEVAQSGEGIECLPDVPWIDDTISAPFDLPLPGVPHPIKALPVKEFLPPPFDWNEDVARP